ncbi:MAG: RNA helicase [Fushun dicistrovirus 1]|nr:MAG: RNA helicase [Fushun dicistrovirus 1]
METLFSTKNQLGLDLSFFKGTPVMTLANETENDVYAIADYLLLTERDSFSRRIINAKRLENGLSAIVPWYRKYEPLSVFPNSFVDYDAMPKCYFPDWTSRPSEGEAFYEPWLKTSYDPGFVNVFLETIRPYGATYLDVMNLSPLIGLNDLDYFVQEYFDRLWYEEPEYFCEETKTVILQDLFKYKPLPILLPGLAQEWAWHLPHYGIKNLFSNICLNDLGISRICSRMERTTSSWKGNGVAIQCSDGVVYSEGSHGIAQSGDIVSERSDIFSNFINKHVIVLTKLSKLPKAQLFDLKIDLSTFMSDFGKLARDVTSSVLSSLEGPIASLASLTKTVIKFILFLGLYLAVKWLKSELLGDSLLLSLCTLVGFNATCEWYFSEGSDAVAQSGPCSYSPIPLFCLSELFSYRPSKSSLKDLTYFLANAPRAAQGVEYLFEHFKELFVYCSNYFSKHVLGMEVRELSSESPVIRWSSEVEAVCIEYTSSSNYHFDDGHYSQTKNLWLKGLEFLRNPLFKTEHQYISQLNTKIFNLMEKFPERFRNATEGKVRTPPTSVMFYGETGAGKSTITYPICTEVISHILYKNDPNLELDPTSEIYCRNVEQEYWDGYKGQAITVYDDFAQRVDTAAVPNLEFFEIIRTSNIFPYPLHMANLNQKDCTYFSSNMLFMSSNMSPTDIGRMVCSLKYPPAVLRRLGMIVKVERKKNVTLPEDGSFDESCYIFKLETYDFNNSSYPLKTSVEITYESLVDLLISQYERNRQTAATVTEHCRKIQERVRNKYKPQAQMFTFFQDYIAAKSNESQEVVKFRNDPYMFDEYCKLLEFASSWRMQFCHYISETWKIVWEDLNKRFPVACAAQMLWHITCVICGGVMLYNLIKNHMSSSNKNSSKVVLSEQDVCSLAYESNEKVGATQRVKLEVSSGIVPMKALVPESNEKVATSPNLKLETSSGIVPTKALVLESSERVSVTPKIRLESSENPIVREMQAQGVSDVNAAEILGKLTVKNLYSISILRSDGSTIRLGHMIVVRGKACIMPYHFITAIKSHFSVMPKALLEFKCVFTSYPVISIYIRDFLEYDFNTLEPVDGKISDVVAFSFPLLHQHSDILPYFVPKDCMASTLRSRVVLPTLQFPGAKKTLPYAMMSFGTAESLVSLVDNFRYALNVDDVSVELALRSAWKYRLETSGGDCGAPLVLINSSIAKGRIVGIHVAGDDSGYGYSMPLSREDVDKLCRSVTRIAISQQFQEKIECGVTATFPFPGKFVPLGKADVTVASASKTSLTPSLFNPNNKECTKSLCKSEMKPAWLIAGMYEGKPWDPREYRLEKYGSDFVPVPIYFFKQAKNGYLNFLRPLISKIDSVETHFKSKYSFKETCEGFEGDPTLNPIKRSTSVGYPLCVQVKKGKTEIFGSEGPFNYESALARQVESEWTSACKSIESGERIFTVFVNTLKDEKKDIEKAHKTRLFSAGSLLDLLLCRTYFMKAVSILTHLKILCGIAVGTNVYSYDWTSLALHLKSKGSEFIAGDFEGFDSSEQKEILRQAAGILIELCDDETLPEEERKRHQLAREVLMESLLESVHYDAGHLSMWIKGLPSGHYLTALINSLFVILVFCYSFWRATGLKESVAIDTFFKDISFITYGDDHVIGVPKRYLDQFNQFTVEKYLSEIGLTYTTENKTKAEFGSRPLSEITFLKRSFVFNEKMRRYNAPINLKTVRECLLWVKRSEDPHLALEANVGFALRELSMHKPDVWDEWFDRISKCCYANGINVPYSSQDSAFFSCIDMEYDLEVQM